MKLFSPNSITDIKYNSPAHTSGKIEDGDEIIQINYQTVVGWHYNRVIQQLQESLPDVLLTLKKRPKHTKIYGQIYIQPYRLPSKKRVAAYRLDENLPSPRPDLPTSQNLPMMLPLAEKTATSDTDSSTSSMISAEKPIIRMHEKDVRLYLPKSRTVLQRRNTICGDQPQGYRGSVLFWRETDNRTDQDSPSLRDKSVSFGFGLEVASRPTNCIHDIHNIECSKASTVDRKLAADSKKPQTDGPTETNTEANQAEPPCKQTKSKAVKFRSAENIGEREISCSTEANNNTNSISIETYRDASIAAPMPEKNREGTECLKMANEAKPQPPARVVAALEESNVVEAVNTALVDCHNHIEHLAQRYVEGEIRFR